MVTLCIGICNCGHNSGWYFASPSTHQFSPCQRACDFGLPIDAEAKTPDAQELLQANVNVVRDSQRVCLWADGTLRLAFNRRLDSYRFYSCLRTFCERQRPIWHLNIRVATGVLAMRLGLERRPVESKAISGRVVEVSELVAP